MATREQNIQLRAFAQQDGLLLGLFWIVSFAMFAYSQQYPFLATLFDISIVAIPFIAVSRVNRFRDRIWNGTIDYWRAFIYSWIMFMSATLILAIAQWVYFAYIDNGQLVGGFIAAVNKPEMEPVLKAYGINKAELDAQMQALAETRPIDFAMTFACLNMIAGFILSLIIALFTKRNKIIENVQQ